MEGMKMNRLFFTTLLVASAITANAQHNTQKDSLTMETILTSSLKKHTFYNLLINNILYLCVT